MPLQVDYRPQSFDKLLGNRAIKASLESIYGRESDYPHTVLLQGPKGTGKTTIARIIAGILLNIGEENKSTCPDFRQIDGGDIDAKAVKDIKDEIRYKPLMADNKVYIIDEAHMIGRGGASEKNTPQNNMLTVLEEPPKHVYFILCTTDPQRLLGTIRSRAHTFETSNLTTAEIIKLLKQILEAEDVGDIPPDILTEIAQASDGCPRDAIKILDQVIDIRELDQMKQAIQSYNYSENTILDLWNVLLGRQSWVKISAVLQKMDLSNPEGLRRAMLTRMYNVLIKEDNPEAALVYDCFEKPYYDVGKTGFLVSCYKAHIFLAGK